jgi:hypothetical protein
MEFDPYAVITSAAMAKVGAELGIDAAKRIYGPLIDHLGVKFKDRMLGNTTPVLARADNLLEGTGKTITDVPDRFLIPILQRVAINDSDVLAEQWANLLANTAQNPDDILPSFIEILGTLSPLEARLLASWADGSTSVAGISERRHANRESAVIVSNLHDLRIIFSNLERHLLIVPSQHASSFDGLPDEQFLMENIRVTRFGARFILACSNKRGRRNS